MWIEGVANDLDTHRSEWCTGQLWSSRSGRGGETGSLYIGKIDARLFKHGTAFEHARATAATFGAVPIVFAKLAAAVLRFESSGNAVLEVEQVAADDFWIYD